MTREHNQQPPSPEHSSDANSFVEGTLNQPSRTQLIQAALEGDITAQRQLGVETRLALDTTIIADTFRSLSLADINYSELTLREMVEKFIGQTNVQGGSNPLRYASSSQSTPNNIGYYDVKNDFPIPGVDSFMDFIDWVVKISTRSTLGKINPHAPISRDTFAMPFASVRQFLFILSNAGVISQKYYTEKSESIDEQQLYKQFLGSTLDPGYQQKLQALTTAFGEDSPLVTEYKAPHSIGPALQLAKLGRERIEDSKRKQSTVPFTQPLSKQHLEAALTDIEELAIPVESKQFDPVRLIDSLSIFNTLDREKLDELRRKTVANKGAQIQQVVQPLLTELNKASGIATQAQALFAYKVLLFLSQRFDQAIRHNTNNAQGTKLKQLLKESRDKASSILELLIDESVLNEQYSKDEMLSYKLLNIAERMVLLIEAASLGMLKHESQHYQQLMLETANKWLPDSQNKSLSNSQITPEATQGLQGKDKELVDRFIRLLNESRKATAS